MLRDWIREKLQPAAVSRLQKLGREQPEVVHRLTGLVEGFKDTATWAESRSHLEDSPELFGEPARIIIDAQIAEAARDRNDNLVSVLKHRRDLINACRSLGIEAAFAAIAQHRPGFVSAEMKSLIDDFVRAQTEYLAQPRTDTIDACIRTLDRIIAHRGFPDATAEFRALLYQNEGVMAFNRYLMRGESADLEAAARQSEAALAETRADAPALGPRLGRLSLVLRFRFKHFGDSSDIDRAIELAERSVQETSPEEPSVPIYLDALANALRDRHAYSSQASDLDRAIEIAERGLSLVPHNSAESASLLGTLGNILVGRFLHCGDVKDLERGLAALEEAVLRLPPEAPDFAMMHNNLGSALATRYEHTGNAEDLDRAIGLIAGAVNKGVQMLPDQLLFLSNLNRRLRDRYELGGDVQDLDRSVEVLDAALADLETGCRGREGIYDGLGASLLLRYQRTGNSDDLDRAVSAFETSVSEAAPASADYASHQGNLGLGLVNRFVRSGLLADLDRGIEAFDEAVRRNPRGSVERSAALNNLGNAFTRRFQRSKKLEDIDKAIEALEEAVNCEPETSPQRWRTVNNLGLAYRYRFLRTQNPADLERASDLFDNAESRAPREGPSRSVTLGNRGLVRVDRYDLQRDPEDLTRALEVFTNALAVAIPEAGDESMIRHNIGMCLVRRSIASGSSADTEAATQAMRESMDHGDRGRADSVLQTAGVWGSWALDRKAWPEAAEAFTRGQKAARRLSRIQLGRQHKESWLREASGFGAGAAFSLAKCDSLKQAVVALDESRALLLSDAIERDRTAFERLEMLGKADLVRRYRGLAERLHSLEQLQAGYDSMMFDKVSGTGQASSADMQALSEAFDAVIKEIRCVEGYEGFLKSITFEEVVTSAAESPLAYLGSTDQGGLWLVVEPGSEQLVHVIWLPQLTEAEVESQVRTYLDSYEARKIDPEGWTHSLDRTTHWLWDACMGPLLDDLAKASEVVLVPTGLLGMLPLHAAWIRDVATPCGRRYALDVLRIRYVPSARVLREASRAAGQVSGDSALVVDDPGCDDAPLQYSANESDAVRRAFPQVRYVGKHQATREVVLDALSTASVAHLSCHGTASVDQPLDSSLQMADGDLTLREIMYRRAVRASVGRLTVLSACETAVGGADLPDEVVNLSTGFLQAGFAGVIGTLWPVPEASTMLLMVEFYRLWQMEHLEPAEALRQAQIRVRDWTNKEIRDRFPTVHELSGATIPREARTFWESARRHADPYHWAAFCFVGA